MQAVPETERKRHADDYQHDDEAWQQEQPAFRKLMSGGGRIALQSEGSPAAHRRRT